MFTDVSLPPSLQKAKEKAEREEQRRKERKGAERRVSFGNSPQGKAGKGGEAAKQIGQEEIGERMDAKRLGVDLDGVRAEYPVQGEARLMRMAEILHARYENSVVPILNNWDAPYCYVNAESRALLERFVSEVSAEDSRSFVEFLLAEAPQSAIRLCASLVARKHPALVLEAAQGDDSKMAAFMLVAAAGVTSAHAAKALQVLLSQHVELDSLDTSALEAIVGRLGKERLDDSALAVRVIESWMTSERGSVLFSQVQHAFVLHPSMFEALFPFALSDTQGEALACLSRMLLESEQCFRAWPRLHPLHVMASANLFTYLAKSPVAFPLQHVERLAQSIEKVPVQKKFAEPHAVAVESAQRWLANSKARGSRAGSWLIAGLTVAALSLSAGWFYLVHH